MRNRGLESQACLPYLLVTERDNPDKPQLSVAARFELCLTTAAEVAALHARDVIPECLSLYGTIVDATSGTIKVTLAGIKMPKDISWIATSGYFLDDLLITTSDSHLSEKSSVQLLGLLFLKIFQPMLQGEHLQSYRSIDKTSEKMVLNLFGLMLNPNPELRPTLQDTISSLRSISSKAMLVQFRPSAAAIEHYRQAVMRKKHHDQQDASRTRPLTLAEEREMQQYASQLMQEQIKADRAAAACSAAPASSVSSREMTAAAAAAAVTETKSTEITAISLSNTSTLFSNKSDDRHKNTCDESSVLKPVV